MAEKSMFDNLKKQLRELDGAQLIVGVQGEPGKNAVGETLSADEELQKIAWVHEFGMDIDVTPKMRAWLHYNGIHLKQDTTKIHISERSFIRSAASEGKAAAINTFYTLIDRLMKEEITAEQLLDQLGVHAVENVTMTMGHGVKHVSQYTLDHRKQSPNPLPLADTGKLRRHVTYRIEKKGGEGSDTTFRARGSG